MITELLIAGCGGFVGTACRHLTGVLSKKLFKTSYPVGTFTVNILGCFIIGLFAGILAHNGMGPLTKALLVSGFCGGFTTFSSFSHDSYVLIKNREYGKYIMYVLPTIVLGLLMVWVGMKCI